MQKNKSLIFIAIGIVLLLGALPLFLHNVKEDEIAGQEAEQLLAQIQQVVEERASDPSLPMSVPLAPAADNSEPEQEEPGELPEIDVGGYSCVGVLQIPKLMIQLPVISEWDYNRLKKAPCRQSGSTNTDDLVIAAHNYDHHFGMLKELKQGDTVLFTDMNGGINQYAVEKADTLASTAVDTVLESDYDLVLYTCTKGGAMRVAVFCNRMSNRVEKE